jgi:hypothetical protein
MATLLNAVTTDTVGSATSHSGPATVFVTGTTDGAAVVLQISPSTNTTDFVKIDRSLMPQSLFVDQTGACGIDAQGTYYLRAILERAGSSTSVTVTSTQ